MISSISITELRNKINSINIIDIRSSQSYNNNHIPSAINIPMEKLLVEPKKHLQANTIYYIYCQKGISSSKVCQILNRMGYHTINISGGYEEWILQN